MPTGSPGVENMLGSGLPSGVVLPVPSRVFLDYELPEIQEFRHAQSQFKTDLPTVLENLRATVAEAEADNPGYQEAAASFLDLCRKTIGPAVSLADVREMLLQHILTKDIFLSIFKED